MRQVYYFFADSTRIALQSIWAQKLRAFLTLLGVIFGVAAVVVMGASISGVNYFFADSTRIALQSIWAQKLRAFLTLLGVIFGVAAVVVMGASISGVNDYIVSTVGRILGTNHFMMARFAHQGEWSEDDWDRAWKRNKRLRWEDYEWMLANCKECAEVGANVSTNIDTKYGERELFGTQIVGVTSSMAQIESKTIPEGRFIAAHEVE